MARQDKGKHKRDREEDAFGKGHTGAALLYVLLSVLIGVAVIFTVEYLVK